VKRHLWKLTTEQFIEILFLNTKALGLNGNGHQRVVLGSKQEA
jgi:hypothetical protein